MVRHQNEPPFLNGSIFVTSQSKEPPYCSSQRGTCHWRLQLRGIVMLLRNSLILKGPFPESQDKNTTHQMSNYVCVRVWAKVGVRGAASLTSVIPRYILKYFRTIR